MRLPTRGAVWHLSISGQVSRIMAKLLDTAKRCKGQRVTDSISLMWGADFIY